MIVMGTTKFPDSNKYIRKLRSILVSKLYGSAIYVKLYPAYWHRSFARRPISSKSTNYFAAIPNPGAGIGHQMANWIAGLWFSKKFGLRFAHTPFSREKWEKLLGFGIGEECVTELITKRGYRIVRLPLFDEQKTAEVTVVQQLIDSYKDADKIIFLAEQDQFYRDQFGVLDIIRSKFHSAPSRVEDNLFYDKTKINIAIHIRRGDIAQEGQRNENNSNLSMRWLNNDYYRNIVKSIVNNVDAKKTISIYIFSQGRDEEFLIFNEFENVNLCLSFDEYLSFIHMVFADVLITSRSSFSYKPALLSNGVKICPSDFWHGYPDTPDFFKADAYGGFDIEGFLNVLNEQVTKTSETSRNLKKT